MPSVLDDYLAQIDDPDLRTKIRGEFEKTTKDFGLVFERHQQEGIRMPKAPVELGSKVILGADDSFHQVVGRDGDQVTLSDRAGDLRTEDADGVTVAREFGDIMYPGLKPVDEIRNGKPGDPVHTVINGENYHALEMLQYTHAGKIDLIYVDPPYNTGNKTWKYNDRYVAEQDSYRHSKWLSFMEKRLLLAKKLLTPTGVIIVAIGDDEHHRLRMLMDQVFGAGNFISNIVWQGGRKNDSKFVSNGADYMLVYAQDSHAIASADIRWREKKSGVGEVLAAADEAWKGALVEAIRERDAQMSAEREKERQRTGKYVSPSGDYWSFVDDAVRRKLASEGRRTDSIVYDYKAATTDENTVASFLDLLKSARPEEAFAVRARAGEIATARMKEWWKLLPKDHPAQGSKHYSHIDGWSGRLFFPDNISWPGGGGPTYDVFHPLTGKPVPVPSRGWVYSTPDRMQQFIDGDLVYFGRNDERGINRKSFLEEVDSQVADSVFYRDRRAAAKHLAGILGSRDFPYPKDVDVLARWIKIATASRPDAVVLDFFGGTGTTAEAVMRLNAEDGGTRQAILVTNNELSAADDKKLRAAGHTPGDPEYEALGVFHHVTRPRISTVVTGIREDGSKYSDGLAANVAFFDLEYLDRARIKYGHEFDNLAGLFWLRAGGRGPLIHRDTLAQGYAISPDSSIAVLFRPGRASQLAAEIASTAHQQLTHVFIVSDSDEQGNVAASYFNPNLIIERIYGTYLSAFQVNKKD